MTRKVYLSAVVIVMSVHLDSRAGGTQTPYVDRELRAAFYAESKDWPEEYVDPLIAEIKSLISSSEGGITDAKIRDLRNGLGSLARMDPVRSYTHPVRREMLKQKTLDRVRSYLAHGYGSEAGRSVVQDQVAELLKRWEPRLVRAFPRYYAEIQQAVEKTLIEYRDLGGNPLLRMLKRPATDEELDWAEKRFSSYLEQNRLPERMSEGKAISEFAKLLGDPIWGLGYDTRAPAVPESAKYQAAMEELERNHVEIECSEELQRARLAVEHFERQLQQNQRALERVGQEENQKRIRGFIADPPPTT